MYDPYPAARLLRDACPPGTPVACIPDDFAPTDLDQAYAVQDALAELLAPDLGPPSGYKVGCTNAAARDLLGIDSCFSGRCFEAEIRQSPATLVYSNYHMVGIEPEIAIRVGQDLVSGEAWTAERVAELAIEVIPSIEVVESRFSTWPRMGALAAVADNGVHRELILGQPVPDWTQESVAGTRVSLEANGQNVQQGYAQNVDGGPFGVLAWLANHLNTRGTALLAHQVVTTGVLTSIYNADRGQHLVADYGPFGMLEIDIT